MTGPKTDELLQILAAPASKDSYIYSVDQQAWAGGGGGCVGASSQLGPMRSGAVRCISDSVQEGRTTMYVAET